MGIFGRWRGAIERLWKSTDDSGAGPRRALSESSPSRIDQHAAGPSAPALAPFADIASAELDAAAARLVRERVMTLRESSDTHVPSLRLDGPCPRCDHHFSQTRALVLPASAVRGNDHAPEQGPAWADFLCECSVDHPGAPSGEQGCGAGFSLGRPVVQRSQHGT